MENILLQSYLDTLKSFTIFDDNFMRFALDVPSAQCILRAVLNEPSLVISNLHTEHEIFNLDGRSIILDAYVTNEGGRHIDMEMQKYTKGMPIDRAIYHSEMIGVKMSQAKDEWTKRVERIVIFFVEKDIFQKGQPIYFINRMLDGEIIDSKEVIIYVNMIIGVDDGTELGKIKHDLLCKEAKEAYNEEIRELLKRTKETKEGEEKMCEKMDKLMKKVKEIERENGIKIGQELGQRQGIKIGEAKAKAALEQERIANAKSMLENGATIDFVIKCISLPLDTIQQLQKEII